VPLFFDTSHRISLESLPSGLFRPSQTVSLHGWAPIYLETKKTPSSSSFSVIFLKCIQTPRRSLQDAVRPALSCSHWGVQTIWVPFGKSQRHSAYPMRNPGFKSQTPIQRKIFHLNDILTSIEQVLSMTSSRPSIKTGKPLA